MSDMVATLLQIGGLLGLLAAAAVDVRSRILPNDLVIWVMAAGLASRGFAEGAGSWVSLMIAVGIFIPLRYLTIHDVIGGGDAKMITATTFLVAPSAVPQLLLAIALAGGVLAAAYLAGFRAFRARLARTDGLPRAGPSEPAGLIESELARIAAHEPMPYGLAILGGAVFVIIRGAI